MFESRVMDESANNKGDGKKDQSRVSKQAWLPYDTNDATKILDERVAELIRVPRELGLEDVRLLNCENNLTVLAHPSLELPARRTLLVTL